MARKEPLPSARQLAELGDTPGPVGEPHLPAGSKQQTHSTPRSTPGRIWEPGQRPAPYDDVDPKFDANRLNPRHRR